MCKEDYYQLYHGDSLTILKELRLKHSNQIALTILDPPFNQNKDYPNYDDNLPEESYWKWMKEICALIFGLTIEGGRFILCRERKILFIYGRAWKKLAGQFKISLFGKRRPLLFHKHIGTANITKLSLLQRKESDHLSSTD